MNDFNLSNFEINTTEKYKLCVTYNEPLSADNLTILFMNGWKLISFNGFKGTTIAKFGGGKTEQDAFAYMFENLNFNEKKK